MLTDKDCDLMNKKLDESLEKSKKDFVFRIPIKMFKKLKKLNKTNEIIR